MCLYSRKLTVTKTKKKNKLVIGQAYFETCPITLFLKRGEFKCPLLNLLWPRESLLLQ